MLRYCLQIYKKLSPRFQGHAEAKSMRHSSPYDRQNVLPLHEGIFAEYLEIMTQYGFLVLFAAAFPLGPLGVVFNNTFEMRTDAIKLTKQTKKPFSQPCNGIGTWMTVLHFMNAFAILSNTALICFSSEALWSMLGLEVNTSDEQEATRLQLWKAMGFIVIEV